MHRSVTDSQCRHRNANTKLNEFANLCCTVHTVYTLSMLSLPSSVFTLLPSLSLPSSAYFPSSLSIPSSPYFLCRCISFFTLFCLSLSLPSSFCFFCRCLFLPRPVFYVAVFSIFTLFCLSLSLPSFLCFFCRCQFLPHPIFYVAVFSFLKLSLYIPSSRCFAVRCLFHLISASFVAVAVSPFCSIFVCRCHCCLTLFLLTLYNSSICFFCHFILLLHSVSFVFRDLDLFPTLPSSWSSQCRVRHFIYLSTRFPVLPLSLVFLFIGTPSFHLLFPLLFYLLFYLYNLTSSSSLIFSLQCPPPPP
jgi:hypothetical protein